MGLFSNKINSAELEPGDHIYSWRRPGVYAHHGIFMGDGMVIHFDARPGEWDFLDKSLIARPPPEGCKNCRKYRKKALGDEWKTGNYGSVIISCLVCFLSGGKLERCQYSASAIEFAMSRPMTCTTADSDPPGRVLERAYSVLQQGFGKYNIVANNCENFAYFCKTGKNSPPDGRMFSFAAGAAAGAGLVTFVGLTYAHEKYRNRRTTTLKANSLLISLLPLANVASSIIPIYLV